MYPTGYNLEPHIGFVEECLDLVSLLKKNSHCMGVNLIYLMLHREARIARLEGKDGVHSNVDCAYLAS